MTSFAGKNALIFGAGRNIGRAIAREFAKRGARLAVADIDAAGAAETAELIRAAGGDAVSLHCDVMQALSIREAAGAAHSALGEIDIVMNNAGVLQSGNPEDIPLDEWERTLSCNLLSMVRSNEVFLPLMLARGHGHIVNTASFAGLYPYAANRLPYAAAKAAVISLSQNLAIYLLPKGIRVSCLCPGPVMTSIADSMKNFSGQVAMRGPGAQFWLKGQEETACILADGMEAGRIIIPTDDGVHELLLEWAASPDAFIHKQIAAFAAGDAGLPQIDRARFGL